MSIKLGDIFVDENGKLWRVTGTCKDPTVSVEAVEPSGYIPPPEGEQIDGKPLSGSFLREHKNGGIYGLMWQGFRQIYRPQKPPTS